MIAPPEPKPFTATCSKCRAPMGFVQVANSGKKMPIDPQRIFVSPDPKGATLIITEAGEMVRGHALTLDAAAQATEVRSGFISHFATCAHGATFRKDQKR